MYHAELGQFITRDPLPQEGEPDVLYDNNEFGRWLDMMKNLYGYVGGNPVNLADPSGLSGYEFPGMWDYNTDVPMPVVAQGPDRGWVGVRPAQGGEGVVPNPPRPPARPANGYWDNRDYFDCLSACIEQRTLTNAGTAALHVGNAGLNATVGRYPRSGLGGQRPGGGMGSKGSPSTWQHRSGLGKATGRVCIVATVAQGFFDIGAQIACSLICGDLYPTVDKNDWVR